MTTINGIDVSDCLTYNAPSHAEITVRYADGSTKTVNYTEAYKAKTGQDVRTLAGSFLTKLKAAYEAAGHEIIDVNNIEMTVELTQAELEEIAAGRIADRDHADYVRRTNMIYAVSAGGESHDSI